MPALKLLGLFLVSSVLIACASSGRSFTESTMQETLDIEILPNTSKMFVYRLRWPENEIPSLVRIEHGGSVNERPDPGGVQVGRSTEERLRNNAAYVIKRMGYCREGFLEIDSSSSRYHLWLKGECKEGASAEDRQRFGEKQTLPVKFNS